MKLKINEIKKASAAFLFLKKQSPEYFEETGIVKCLECNGTGLKNYRKIGDNDFTWDTSEFCCECKGIGYKNLFSYEHNIIDGSNCVCKHCEGRGCSTCNHGGITDWVTNLMGGMGR